MDIHCYRLIRIGFYSIKKERIIQIMLEGAAGRKTEEGAPAAMVELAIFLRTSLHPCSPAARAARSARAAPDGAPWRGADGAGAMRRGEGSGRSSGAPFSGKIRPREGLLHPPRRRIGAQQQRIGSCLE